MAPCPLRIEIVFSEKDPPPEYKDESSIPYFIHANFESLLFVLLQRISENFPQSLSNGKRVLEELMLESIMTWELHLLLGGLSAIFCVKEKL